MCCASNRRISNPESAGLRSGLRRRPGRRPKKSFERYGSIRSTPPTPSTPRARRSSRAANSPKPRSTSSKPTPRAAPCFPVTICSKPPTPAGSKAILPGADRQFAQYIDFRDQPERSCAGLASGRLGITPPDARTRPSPPGEGDWTGSRCGNLRARNWSYGRISPDCPPIRPQLKPVYERTSPALDGITRVLYASALAASRSKGCSQETIGIVAAAGPGRRSALQSLLFPKYLELKRQLN